jgi:hypothetical protein
MFLSKGKHKIVKESRLEDIEFVEPHTYQLLIPGGVPCVKYRSGGREYLFSLWSSWNPTHLRDIWVRYIGEMAAAWKMSNYLKDPSVVLVAQQGIHLSAALTRRVGRSAPPGYFQYFIESFPEKHWFSIPDLFQSRGMLNIDYESDATESEDIMHTVLLMLHQILQLIHLNLTEKENYVDFTALKESDEFQHFLRLSFLLQKSSMEKLSAGQTTVMFVNLYNTLLLHAYVELEKFPENVWEWRYLERTAYYTVSGVAYSLWDMHHGVLRHNRPSPGGNEIPFFSDDPRLAILDKIIYDPCVIFALSQHSQ